MELGVLVAKGRANAGRDDLPNTRGKVTESDYTRECTQIVESVRYEEGFTPADTIRWHPTCMSSTCAALLQCVYSCTSLYSSPVSPYPSSEPSKPSVSRACTAKVRHSHGTTTATVVWVHQEVGSLRAHNYTLIPAGNGVASLPPGRHRIHLTDHT